MEYFIKHTCGTSARLVDSENHATPDKARFFQPKSIDILIIPPQKYMLRLLIGSTCVVTLISTHNMFLWRIRKKIFT